MTALSYDRNEIMETPPAAHPDGHAPSAGQPSHRLASSSQPAPVMGTDAGGGAQAPDGPDALTIATIAVAALLGLVALVLGGMAFVRSGRTDDRVTELTEQLAAMQVQDAPEAAASALVYSQLSPSVVVVQVDRSSSGGNDARDDRGLGSGVIVNAAGEIVTARHVVVDADEILVRFSDGTESTATVASSDPDRDLVVLRAARNMVPITPAVLGVSAAADVGDPVFVVGHPLGLTASISGGIISGFDRTVPLDDGTSLIGLIQFDAAVNPGSSGAPLVTGDGQVIGIVTALANPTDQPFFSGVGFAIPVDIAAEVVGMPDQ